MTRKWFSILVANSSPLSLRFSRVRYNLCNTLSGASSPKSKTFLGGKHKKIRSCEMKIDEAH